MPLCRYTEFWVCHQQPTKPVWELIDAFFLAGLPVALAPVLLCYHSLLPVLWVSPTNAEAVEKMTSRNTNTIRAVQSDLTLSRTAEEREAETCWCEQELCGFEPTLNHHIYLKEG